MKSVTCTDPENFPPGGGGGCVDAWVGTITLFSKGKGLFSGILPGEFDKFEISRGGPDLPQSVHE